LHYRDDTGLIAHHQNLVVTLHWRHPTVPMVNDLRALTDEVVAEHDRFASAIVVIGERLPDTPDADTRRALVDLVRHTKETGLGTAFVVMAGGFLTGAAVALLSGLFTLARTREPSQAFRELEPAAAWLEKMLRVHHTPWRPGEVSRVLDDVVAMAPALSGG